MRLLLPPLGGSEGQGRVESKEKKGKERREGLANDMSVEGELDQYLGL